MRYLCAGAVASVATLAGSASVATLATSGARLRPGDPGPPVEDGAYIPSGTGS